MPSSKSKSTPKAVEPKAKYAVNQRVFVVSYHKNKPEELKEAKVWAVNRRTTSLFNFGKVIGSSVQFTYDLTLPDGSAQNFDETSVYPSFFEAAKVFAKSFLTLLK